MYSVMLLEKTERKVRLGIQGSTDEILSLLRESESLVEETLPVHGAVFYLPIEVEIVVNGGQVVVEGPSDQIDGALETIYAAVGRPTNEAMSFET